MKSPGLFARLDDLMNPIVVKELRQAVRSRIVVAALLLFLFLQVLILGVYLVMEGAEVLSEGIDFRAGAKMFYVLHVVLLGTCMLLVPGYAGGRLAAERSDTNVDLLFISSLKPRAIVWGKFLAAFLLCVMVFSACAPFMTFTYLMRGIDIPTILVVLGLDLLVVLAATQFSLFVAAIPANRGLKAFLGLLALFGLLGTFGSTCAITERMVESALLTPDSWEFWAALGSMAAVVLGLMGLFYFWTVAIIKPPSANRALPVRLYLLAVWLATGAIALAWTFYVPYPVPAYVWLTGSVLLFCVQLGVAINERDHWGPRVARTIPRNPLLRVPAFLFYSGAAGGFLFGVVMLALTFGGPVWMIRYQLRLYPPHAASTERVLEPLRVFLIMALYTFCFSLSGVLFRITLLAERVRALYTWLISLLLVGLGSAVPALVAYFWYYDDPHPGVVEWWLLANPIAAVVQFGGGYLRNEDFISACWWFVSIWAVAVALLSIPWFYWQARRFRPAEGRRAVARPVEEEVLTAELVEVDRPERRNGAVGARPAVAPDSGPPA